VICGTSALLLNMDVFRNPPRPPFFMIFPVYNNIVFFSFPEEWLASFLVIAYFGERETSAPRGFV
jgi:hypothetical protein